MCWHLFIHILPCLISPFTLFSTAVVCTHYLVCLQIVIAIIAYSFCSSTLLLANKMVMADLPLPSVVSFIQMVFTVLVIYFLQGCGVKVDTFEWSKLQPYVLYIIAFVAAIYTNMQALNYSNIETVIVFRSCTPISVTVVEYLFMGRDLPSMRSAMVSTRIG